MPKRQLLAAAVATAVVGGGGIAGALLGVPDLTAAQETTTSTTEAGESSRDPQGDASCERHHGRFLPAGLGVAADKLGISEDALRDALRDGKSIADVADERNVELQGVIDALVDEATKRIDQAVSDGRLDADRAAELKDDLPERARDLVNRQGLRGPGRGRHYGGF